MSLTNLTILGGIRMNPCTTCDKYTPGCRDNCVLLFKYEDMEADVMMDKQAEYEADQEEEEDDA